MAEGGKEASYQMATGMGHGVRFGPPTKFSLRLAPLLFVRPGELRHALWADFDLEAGEWRYLVTKTQTLHIGPRQGALNG